MILAGDVGGTKTCLGLFAAVESGLRMVASQRHRTLQFSSLAEMVRDFVPKEAKVTAAAFGVAGAVVDGRASMTNVPWTLDCEGLNAELGFPCHLCNDLVATGNGISALADDQFLTLQEGVGGRKATAALIAAGTGLGESILYWNNREHVALQSEGGTAGFAPQNEQQAELYKWMLRRVPVVSVERVLSGPGLVNIYEFLRETNPGAVCETESTITGSEDKAGAIAAAAERNACRICQRALEMFLSIYGAEAGNLALRAMALGGVYIGGGIAAKLSGAMQNGTFMRAFREKDGVAELMSQIPVRIILESRTPLFGAARVALHNLNFSRQACSCSN
jgi:glucokinase